MTLGNAPSEIGIKRQGLQKRLKGQLSTLRRRGMDGPMVDDLTDLTALAALLTGDGASNQQVEALLELAIDGSYGAGTKMSDVARLSFGLDEATRKKDVNDRHDAAWKRYGKDGRPNFTSHITSKIQEALASELCRLYDQRDAQAEVPPTTADPTEESPPDEAVETAPVPPPSREALEQSKPVTWRHWQLPQKILVAVLAGVALVLALHRVLAPMAPSGPPSLGSLEAKANRILAKRDTPVPGAVSPVLGFGDEIGGRSVYPYTQTTPTTYTPTFNSIVDAPYGQGDEREFLHVAALTPKEARRIGAVSRGASLTPGDVASVRVYIENSAAPQPDCSRLAGPTIARNSRLRVTVWSSPSRLWHVIRAWVSADNTYPRWVTDSVPVITEKPADLFLDPDASSMYSAEPPGFANKPRLTSRRVLHAAGMPVGFGEGGLIGSCWENKFYLILIFRQKLLSN